MTRQQFYDRLVHSDPAELRLWIRNAGADEQVLFEEAYGADRFQRIRKSAVSESEDVSLGVEAVESAARPNVVVIPGIMGSELFVAAGSSVSKRIWVDLGRLVFEGRISDLTLEPDGRTSKLANATVSAPGILRMYFDELEQFLLPKYNVKHFSYDWRLDVRTIARQLEEFLTTEFGNAPVHLIAHSMGGLVARALIAFRLASGVPRESVLGLGGRLIMLGTPNQGTFEAFKILSGTQDAVQILALGLQSSSFFSTDFEENVRTVLNVVNSFPSVYQMLPRPELLPVADGIDFYDSSGYSGIGSSLNNDHFQAARETHTLLEAAVLPEMMRIVAGCDTSEETAVGLKIGAQISATTSYSTSDAGDGTVSHELTKLPDVPLYFVEGDHGDLTSLPEILDSLDDLLLREPDAVGLSRKPVLSPDSFANWDSATKSRDNSNVNLHELRLAAANTKFQALAVAKRNSLGEALPSSDEIRLIDLLLLGWLGHVADDLTSTKTA